MSSRTLKAAVVAALALSTGAIDAHAAGPVYVTQSSSAVGWSQAGDHADLVLRYSGHANTMLTINVVGIFDIGGAGMSQLLYNCGTPVKTGDTVTAHTIAPGGLCFLRGFRSPYEIAGRLVMSDNTGTGQNINNFVRASLEVRDGSDNVLTHIDLR